MRKSIMGLGLLALAAILTAAACGGDDEEAGDPSGDGSGAVTLDAGDFFFSSTELTADPGQTLTVTVSNNGVAEHTFTIDDLGVDEVVKAGEEKAIDVAADQSGTFEYYCRFHHSKMTGTLTIGDAAAAPADKDSSGSGSGYGY